MATSALSCSPGLLLTLFLLATSAASEVTVRITHTMIGCYPAATNDSSFNATAFRASLLPLLGALPSAAAPTGFASLRSDRAFARGVCFGDAAPSGCLGCLSVAGKNLTDGCGATIRLAGVWNDGCFVSYADTAAPSGTTLVSTALVPRSEPSDPSDPNGFSNLTIGLFYALVAMQFINLMLTIANVLN
ncbi:uncharacterized protein LOC119367438 [Triticum dicoccoides]|uniref:uncharacterized protein LOC119367438 n=1 Tax=Triticum dicoccoides TaxID=85692 RepID=UPI00189017F7|nr:uncharacterized protein LOC119367438 [Triticum dicoccoides]XP_037488849.1 uncharacterized protein LOC119367438 [Triticum dicoccoides]